jgi:drug/metabolite transporter (DMT)-like permease
MKVWQADLCVFTAAMIGAITYPIAQYILQQMDLLLFHIIRFPLLSLLFLPLVLRQASVPWRSLWQAALPGVFLWLGIICWSFGVMLTDKIGSAAFIISLQSIFAPFLSRLVFGTRLQLGVFVSLFIATGGMALLNLQQGFAVDEASLWMLGSAVFNAFYLICNSRFARGFSPITMSWAQFTACGILSAVASLFVGDFHVESSLPLWLGLIFMVVISTGLRFTLMTLGQQVTTAARAASLVMLEPVMVAIIGWGFLNSYLTTLQTAGCALIFAAVVLVKPKPLPELKPQRPA